MKSKFFSIREMACRGEDCCDNSCPMNPVFMEVLDKLREESGGPVHVNSGFRCNKHNKREGGSARSKHTLGLAADIYSNTASLDKLAEIAESLDLFVLRYDTFIHVDGRHL